MILRVATLNVWNKGERWEDRARLIRKELERLAPDVVGLQEVVLADGSTQADEVARDLFPHVVFAPSTEPAPGFAFGNAVLSRWPIESTERFALPDRGSGNRRTALSAHVRSPAGLLPFFTTHLSWRPDHGYVREAQVVALDAWARARCPDVALPAVLVGDLNAPPESAEVRFLRGLQSLEGGSTSWADAWEVAGEGEGATYDGRANGFAAHHRRPPRRIDYVLTRGPDDRGRCAPARCARAFVEPEGGVWASDHFGVFAELEI